MTPGRALLIKLIDQYKSLGYSLGKLEIQKLCYFMQEAGEELRLNFVKNKYGPYADNLRHVLNDINGHYIAGLGDHDTSESEIYLTSNAVKEAEDFLSKMEKDDSKKRLERVGRLIEGFNSPSSMELLATVHWVATKDVKSDVNLENVKQAVYCWDESKPDWNERKKQIMEVRSIELALNRLKEEGWTN